MIYDNLNLQVQKGKVTAIMGPSGIGKTTLLRLIGGQILPESGEILFDGRDICKANNKELYEIRQRMGMLFQSGRYLPIFLPSIMWLSRFGSIPVYPKS